MPEHDVENSNAGRKKEGREQGRKEERKERCGWIAAGGVAGLILPLCI